MGPGAIGTLFATYLKAAGIDTVLIDYDPERARRISSKPLVVWSKRGSIEASVECVSDVAVAKEAEHVLISVKAYSTEAAAQALGLNVSSPHVVSLQNGLGNLEILGKWFDPSQISAASTGEASTYIAPGEVYHAASGVTKIAPLTAKCMTLSLKLVKLLQKAGFDSVLIDNPETVIWEKLIINSSINAVTAIARIKNGDILRYPSLKTLTSEVAQESYEVALKKGIIPDFKDPAGMVLTAASTTSKNKSSMLQDIERGRRTEVDFINGAIYSLGEASGVPTPLNATLYVIVKSMEERLMKTSARLEPAIVAS